MDVRRDRGIYPRRARGRHPRRYRAPPSWRA